MKMATKTFFLFTALSLLPVATVTAQDGILAIEEIVVTARKRNESLQDVPIAITVFLRHKRSSARASKDPLISFP